MEQPAQILICSLILLAGVARAQGTIEVCNTCQVSSIRQAIAQSRPGDSIRVEPGTYDETGLMIDKPLRLIGVGRPVLDGQGKGTILSIRSEGVSVSGFRIQNSGYSYLDDLAGIDAQRADNCVIRDNQLYGNFFSIHIGNSRHCIIEDNRIVGPDRSESASGNGIHLWHVDQSLVQGNHVTHQRDGIYFEFVTHCKVMENTSEDNLRYGLHFMFSNDDEYDGNTFRSNAAGVAVMYSRRIVMKGNRFEMNWGSSAYGILLKEIGQSNILGNHFLGNTVGIYLEGTTQSLLSGNEFKGNGWAMRVLGDSDGNRIVRNDFISNTFDVSTSAGDNHNTFSENYWSDYAGVDLNRDGIGDVPFHPVRLSSVLMERYGVSVLLLKSFFFTVADQAERLFPVITSGTLRDERPMMKEVSVK